MASVCYILNVVLVAVIVSAAVQCYVMTENQIMADIKFLSQTSDGVKPSRLREFLLADLRQALPKQQLLHASTPETNCTTDADLQVTQHCTCADYSCARLTNHGKRSRIQRSCEDYCCRRSNLVKKSIGTFDHHQQKNCETTANGEVVPFIVQIFSSKSKTPICLGSLIHPQIVMTTLVCASMQMNDRLHIKVRETIDKYQYRYQVRNVTKRIIPDNFPDMFEKFGFNMALLVISSEIELNNDIRTACLPHQGSAGGGQGISDALKCYVDSLENKNGRTIEKRSPVIIHTSDMCRSKYLEQNRAKMYFPKSTLCAGRMDNQDIGVNLNGAPLFCIHAAADSSSGYQYVQYGMLAWSTAINQSPHLFANISNYRNWIDKKINALELS